MYMYIYLYIWRTAESERDLGRLGPQVQSLRRAKPKFVRYQLIPSGND